MAQPEIRRKTIENKDWVAAGKSISRGVRANLVDMERRRLHMKNLGIELQRKRKELGINPYAGYGIGFNPTPSEAVIRAFFPDAKYNYPFPTGMSSKLGHPGVYVIDFAWPDIKLAVEADGNYHQTMVQRQKDSARDNFFTGLGWTVLRFSNKTILNETTAVKGAIQSTISRLKDTQATVSTELLLTTAK